MAGAEHQGLLLGMELEEARVFEDNLAGVAVDWSKCYDHLGLDYVQDTLLAARGSRMGLRAPPGHVSCAKTYQSGWSHRCGEDPGALHSAGMPCGC